MSITAFRRTKLKKCDVCKSSKSVSFRKVNQHDYVKCQKCGTIYLTTRDLNLKKERKTYLEEPDNYLKIINPEGTRYMAGCVDLAYETKIGGQKGKLLEIGSGLGHLSYTLFSRGWDVSCIELSKEATDWANKVFKLPTHRITIEDFDKKNFDVFVMVEVIEHLYNPLKALKHIQEIANPNAMIFGTTPNTESEHWLKSKQDIYQPHDHIVLFNNSSLLMLLKKAKFKNISIDYFGMGENHDSNLMFSAILK